MTLYYVIHIIGSCAEATQAGLLDSSAVRLWPASHPAQSAVMVGTTSTRCEGNPTFVGNCQCSSMGDSLLLILSPLTTRTPLTIHPPALSRSLPLPLTPRRPAGGQATYLFSVAATAGAAIFRLQAELLR